jgi:hypothetical protein
MGSDRRFQRIYTNYDESFVDIFDDGFEDYTWGKGGSVFYWKDGEFSEFVNSD